MGGGGGGLPLKFDIVTSSYGHLQALTLGVCDVGHLEFDTTTADIWRFLKFDGATSVAPSRASCGVWYENDV